ncbi:hypothetical protein BC941DRAFT_512668 [Chlamydoabsidia padenii]|nr:hypothetical protein BC941DRAFT_512668 [Chlamydoabsidia padenii]
MTIQKSKYLENNVDGVEPDTCQQHTSDDQLLQHYWATQQHDEQDKQLLSWASRTFSATCYKFTIQSDLETRSKSGPLYSFLENWQLHTMYNKSQKILLGIADSRPCVILTGDDFMFTPPLTGLCEQQPLNLGNEDGDTNFESAYWPSSPLHVVNVTDDDDDDDDDDTLDEQPIMIVGRDDRYAAKTTTLAYDTTEQLPPNRYQTVEPHTTKDNSSTWGYHLQQGILFVSQRLVQVAYLVAELAESKTTSVKDQQQGMMASGRYMVLPLFRIWRVFFLGVETMLHQVFSLDTSHTIPLLKSS